MRPPGTGGQEQQAGGCARSVGWGAGERDGPKAQWRMAVPVATIRWVTVALVRASRSLEEVAVEGCTGRRMYCGEGPRDGLSMMFSIKNGLESGVLPRLMAAFLLLAVMLALPTYGQVPLSKPPAPAESGPLQSPDALGRDTPQGTVVGFMRAAGEADFERAARYLDTRQVSRGRVEEGIRQLLAVLNRGLSSRDLALLSRVPEGDLEDGFAPRVERVGVVKTESFTLEIMLERVSRPDGVPIWRFSADTLKEVPAVYEEIRPFWIESLIWTPLREARYLDVPLWQWLGIPLSLLVVIALARLLSRGLFAIMRPLFFWLTGERGAARKAEITGPVRVIAMSLAVFAWFYLTSLPLLARFVLAGVAVAFGIVGLAWLVVRLIDVGTQLAETRLRRANDLGGIAIAQLIGRLGKVLTVLVAALTLLYSANVDLTAALAGLGIGGIAIALAAQKTIENLLGGIMIISDRPVRVGDFCRAGDVLGTVESIGLRSTRIRTLDRTVVSIPNGNLATQNLENYGIRDKFWFRPTLALRYETQADQLRYVLAEIRRMLYEHPRVENDSARVRFARFGNFSLDLDVFAYVRTSDMAGFLEVQEDLLLRIMDIVERGGTGFAFPSSTTYLARDSGLDKDKTQEALGAVRRWREQDELPFPNFHPSRISGFENRIEYPPPGSDVRTPKPPK
jgi:MscS family membrane protein